MARDLRRAFAPITAATAPRESVERVAKTPHGGGEQREKTPVEGFSAGARPKQLLERIGHNQVDDAIGVGDSGVPSGKLERMDDKVNLAEKVALLDKPFRPGIVGYLNDYKLRGEGRRAGCCRCTKQERRFATLRGHAGATRGTDE